MITIDAVSDLEFDLDKAVQARNIDVVEEWVQQARLRQQQEMEQAQRSSHRLMRLLWRAAEELPSEYLQLMSTSVELDFGFIDNINGRTPLHEACLTGRVDLVQLCLSKGVDKEAEDVYERRPLHYAATSGGTEICALLLDAGAEVSPVDMDGHTPLMQAIITGRVDTVEIFLRIARGEGILGPTAFSSDLIPLSLACQHGHLAVARLILQHGGKVLPNSEGLYPQHLAARAGHADICKLLIEAGGASGGGKDRHDKYNQWTPLHYASVGGKPEHVECARVLVEAGCDVNAVDEYGKSAGFYAAWYGVSRLGEICFRDTPADSFEIHSKLTASSSSSIPERSWRLCVAQISKARSQVSDWEKAIPKDSTILLGQMQRMMTWTWKEISFPRFPYHLLLFLSECTVTTSWPNKAWYRSHSDIRFQRRLTKSRSSPSNFTIAAATTTSSTLGPLSNLS